MELDRSLEPHDKPLSAEYLKRHRVSVAQLDEYQICAQSDATNPGLPWTELAEVATDVAFHWDNVDGQLANYAHFLKAVERRAKRVLSKRKTETIVVKAKEATHQVIDGAHLFTGYDDPEPTDYHPTRA
jgi:hypothetical protein